MAKNGGAPKLVLTITLDRETGRINMQGPPDAAACYAMLRAGTDLVVQKLLNPEPERQVKTLDELGIASARRVR